MNSFAILRTNVGLTTNIKIMVDSSYNLSLDSIESNETLSSDKLKNVKFNVKNYYDELVPYFFKNIPSDVAFQIKFDNDVETMSDDFSQQFDELYQYGARNIIDNKYYTEEFEYFAPLYIKRNNLPKKFIVFRIDGPGIQLNSKENFNFEVIQKLKTVKIFDLTKTTKLGQWLERNYTLNNSFPETPLEIDFRSLEFCKWNGIDYQTGGYTTKSFFMDDILDEEKEIFEFEKFMFDQYSNSKLVFPNILNFSFLFDDSPANPETTKKWSLNRYLGFYIDDMELVRTMSPYITPFLRNDVVILEGNVLYSASNVDPFAEGFVDTRPFYVEYNGEYYKVEKFTEQGPVSLVQNSNGNFVNEELQTTTLIKFKIISDVNLQGKELELNQNYGYIEDGVLMDYYNNPLVIDEFDNSDVWLIEIDGIYHNLVKIEGKIKLQSDYSFNFMENDYTYKKAGVETKVSFVVDKDNYPPKKFNIYRLNFTDIKDFDTRIVDTDYSRFEYEKDSELTESDETKMYLENLSSNSNPKDLDDFILEGEVVHIPVSSEYTANWETFKIEKNQLSEIWRKNTVYCRWGFQNSLGGYDLPYLFNNSKIFEDYNRSVNPFAQDPSRIERNLDYFYTINSSTSSYTYHSLHLEKVDDGGNIDGSFRFELDKYLNLGTYSSGTTSATYSFDYFTNFFYQNQKFNNGSLKYNKKKYSEFNIGDKSIPNISLFRGIKFSIYNVDSVELDGDGNIDNINLSTSNKFEDYKLSVILSDNDLTVDSEGSMVSSGNLMNWEIIENWEMDTTYATGSIVLYDGVLYQTITEVSTPEPEKITTNLKKIKSAPYLLPTEYVDYFNYTSQPIIFWSPYQNYVDGDLVFNNDEYYYYDSTGTEDFWNPTYSAGTGYDSGDVVLFKGKYYMSMTSSNNYPPNYRRPHITKITTSTSSVSFALYKTYWTATQSSAPKWWEVTLWSPVEIYYQGEKVVHNEIVYSALLDVPANEVPGISNTYWSRSYSMVPDTNYIYQTNDNAIIEMHNKFYLLTSNTSNSTLDNGIIIYINEKWKNILININVSDNTLPYITNVDRDLIYTDLYKKLTAFNFIQSINDISNKYDFTDYVSYVVIKTDGTISKYNLKNNIKSLPYLIRCDEPDEFETKIFSLTKKPIDLPEKLKPLRKLNNGVIKTSQQLNWFNNTPVASNIIENKIRAKIVENLHGFTSAYNDRLYRFSGYYMPVFYDVQLFNKDLDRTLTGNYKFDTKLTDFGLMKERKFRKVNRKGTLLKLKDQKDFKSIYPMLDEFGLSFNDFYIFSGTWDLNYHIETNPVSGKLVPVELPTITSQVLSQYGQPNSTIIGNQNNQIL